MLPDGLLDAPFIALVAFRHVAYSGRATASHTDFPGVLILKGDGTILIHSPHDSLSPLFYLSATTISADLAGGNIFLNASSNEREYLHAEGRIIWFHPSPRGEEASLGSLDRGLVRGTERDIVDWITSHPHYFGFAEGEYKGKEIFVGTGRIDIAYGETLVEVKKRAGVAVVDQVHRYITSGEYPRAMIVCLKASRAVRQSTAADSRIRLIELGHL